MWYYEQKEFDETPDDFQGFVYCITDINNSRKYIGKKNFWKPKNSPQNKKHENEGFVRE